MHHEEGLIAIRKALNTRKDKTISIDSLIGTKIGTKMAPTYDIIFMDSLEEDILSNSLLKVLVWWHYIDDIFMMWEHGEEELQKFLETPNCYHPTIKFTAEYSRAKINFLDVTVVKKGNQLITDLYIKPTDTH